MFIAGFLRDLAFSLRSWRRSPGSAFLAILALGLSGGALLTLVTLLNALLWRELPVSRPQELVGLSGTDRRSPSWVPYGVPGTLFASLDDAQQVFQSFAGFHRFDMGAVIRSASERVPVEGVSARYFELLGLRPERGRLVDARDVAGASTVATISFRCWQTRFESDPDVVGRTFRLQGELVTVIGVAPRGFTGLEVGTPADLWIPASLTPRLQHFPDSFNFFHALVGRLRPGITFERARPELEALWMSVRESAAAAAVPQMRSEILTLEPRIESAERGFSPTGVYYGRPLALLALACAITILIACANLSGLLLARWSTREVDLAVQAALGASRARLVGQVVGESLALSAVAAILSAPLALWSAKSLVQLVWDHPEIQPLDLGLDLRVLGLMVAMVCAVALCVSLLPAMRVSSSNLTLIRATRGMPARGGNRWGHRLTAAQIALSVPLFVTTWIVAAHLHRLETVDTGFRADGLTTVSLTRQASVAPVADPVAYLASLASTLHSVPGISSVAVSSSAPVYGIGSSSKRPVTGDDGLRGANPFFVQVAPGYFETLSVPLVAGRDFAWSDDNSQRHVAIVTQGLARELFAGAHPIGQRVRLADQADRVLEVIGVVADVRLAAPHHVSQLFLFTALLQQSRLFLENLSPGVLLKSALPQQAVEPLARSAIASLGRDEVVRVRPLPQAMEVTLLRERVMRLGAFYFAGLTTLLVFVGLFAVLDLGVTRRIPEIGLRMALGASTADIRRLVMRDALVTAATGLVVGIPFAFVAGRLIVSSLTLAGSMDVFAFGSAIGLILSIAVLSVLIPLRRASGVTPLEALTR